MSTTWSIEHIPANGGASTFASLAVWGIAGLRMQFVNWGVDQAAITTRGGSIAFEAAQFAYLDKLVVWRNGARFAHFWITGLGLSAEQSESRTYTLSGPSWWLGEYAPFYNASIPYTESTYFWAGTYIKIGMADAVAAGAPVGYSQAIEAALNIGCPDVRRAGTILALVQEAARHVPFSSGWWDSSGEVPILYAARRSAAASVSLAIGTDVIETFGITPLPELKLKSVRIRLGWTGGLSYYFDTAGTDANLGGPNRMQVSLTFPTIDAARYAAGNGVAKRVFADMSTLPWGGTVNLHATDETDIDPIRPGCALNLTGGLSEWSTMDALVQSVVWSVSPEANDCCTLQLGAPDHLGIQDYFSLSASVGSASGAESPTPPVDPSSPIPGTLSDLNGTSTGGGEPGGRIAVQSRGGNWSLDGIPAWDGSPRRFGLNTWSGRVTQSIASVPCVTTYDATGAGTYNPTTLATSSTLRGLMSQGGCTQGAAEASYGYNERPHGWITGCTESVTATAATIVGVGAAGYNTTVVGTIRADLSAEDTEDSAVQRMLSANPAPAWTDSPNTAIRTIPAAGGITGKIAWLRYRTEHIAAASSSHWVFGAWVNGLWVPGHSITVSDATVYPTLTGLAIWSRYRLKIVLQKRPVDAAGSATGDYATGETIYSAPFSTDINGEGGVDWTEIEPEAGYETAIQSATPELY